MASINQNTGEEPKTPMSDVELDKKISESPAGETSDDVRSGKYTKKEDQENEEIDRGPNFNLYSDQEDGDTSANAGVSK